jgi:diguanylate cyclase (GGDEF)-like protein
MLSSSGGETFFVLMPDTDAEGVTVVGERLRSKVESLRIEHKGAAEDGVVTISIGASATVPTRTSSQDSMVDAVEAALLQARSDGGNRIALAPTDLG